MTAIAATISSRGIACASDSMLTASLNGSNVVIEWEKSKIIKVERCHATVSYWGLAGQLVTIPKHGKDPKWIWNTHDWLTKKVSQNRYTILSDFSNWLKDELTIKLKSTSGSIEDKGIGIHILGHELIRGFYIPELFLLSNFQYSNGAYISTENLSLGRHTYHTITNRKDCNLHLHHEEAYRLKVRDFLNAGNMLFFNNGDPQYFNGIANAINYSMQVAQHRQLAKQLTKVSDLAPFVKEPITLISNLQRAFHKEGKRLIGGKIHCLLIEPEGRLLEI